MEEAMCMQPGPQGTAVKSAGQIALPRTTLYFSLAQAARQEQPNKSTLPRAECADQDVGVARRGGLHPGGPPGPAGFSSGVALTCLIHHPSGCRTAVF